MTKKIFEIDDLVELKAYLMRHDDVDALRRYLLSEFVRRVRYRNADEWNEAVRLCECLAIVGWGSHEPLEAVRGSYFNGNPNTWFADRNGVTHYFDAVWSKRRQGMAIDYELSHFHYDSRVEACGSGIGDVQDRSLCSQRNWIAKNPVRLMRGLANCYENSKAVIESMEQDLRLALDRRMRPELYGDALNKIILNCSFSFYDNDHCKTNYIIADEALNLRSKDLYPALLTMYSEKEIDDNGYYLRPRFTYGPFRKDTGTVRVNIVFEKEFSELPHDRQKQLLCDYIIHAVSTTGKRLARKITYDFALLTDDLCAILADWRAMDLLNHDSGQRT